MAVLWVSLLHGLIPKIQVTKPSNDAKAHWKTERGDTTEREMQGRGGKKEKRTNFPLVAARPTVTLPS